MNVPWEGGPIEVTIQQITNAAREFAQAGQPITDNQQRDKLYDLVNASGLLPEACQLWHMKPAADKTWANARIHFLQYAHDRENTTTAADAGFSANHVADAFAVTHTALQDLTNQLANLAQETATQKDTISNLQAQLKDNTNPALPDLVALLAQAQKPTPPNTNNGNTRRSNRLPRKYCWTHGKCAHDGKECNNKAEGHVETATLENKQGSSTKNCS